MSLRARFVPVIAVACAAAAFLPAPARAQAPDSGRGSLRARVGAGVDLGIGDTYPAKGGALGVLGVEWLHRRAPVSARLDFSYLRGPEVEQGAFGMCAADCFFRRRGEVFGLALDGRYTFLSRRALRPYVVSGFGVYLTRTTGTTNWTRSCAESGCIVVAGPAETWTDFTVRPGLHAGTGVAFPVANSEFSLELRFWQLASGSSRPFAVPVLLGFRF